MFGRLIIIWSLGVYGQETELSIALNTFPAHLILDEKTSTNRWGFPSDLFFWTRLITCHKANFDVNLTRFVVNFWAQLRCVHFKSFYFEGLYSWDTLLQKVFYDGHWWPKDPATDKKCRIGGETLHMKDEMTNEKDGRGYRIYQLSGAIKHCWVVQTAIFIVFRL